MTRERVAVLVAIFAVIVGVGAGAEEIRVPLDAVVTSGRGKENLHFFTPATGDTLYLQNGNGSLFSLYLIRPGVRPVLRRHSATGWVSPNNSYLVRGRRVIYFFPNIPTAQQPKVVYTLAKEPILIGWTKERYEYSVLVYQYETEGERKFAVVDLARMREYELPCALNLPAVQIAASPEEFTVYYIDGEAVRYTPHAEPKRLGSVALPTTNEPPFTYRVEERVLTVKNQSARSTGWGESQTSEIRDTEFELVISFKQ